MGFPAREVIKCYYGYLRFSEDIDFTWKDQGTFEGQSQKKIRSYLSDAIDKTGKVFENVAEKRGLQFKCQKNNNRFVELAGSNKLCTLKIWYSSEVLNRETFLKVQINFVEDMCFPPKKGRAKSLLTRSRNTELVALFPESAEYAKMIDLEVYDIREILAEKVRALLTRKGTKARDFLDVYLIYKNYNLKPEDVEKCITRKMAFALKLYSRLGANLKEKAKLLHSEKIFSWGGERDLLISEINDRDFYSFLGEFQMFLKRIVVPDL